MPDDENRQVVCGPGATERVGRELARLLLPGDVVLVYGEVGAGKSTLVRAVLREFGVQGPIPSPTFTVGRTYEGTPASDPSGAPVSLSHLDLHRIGRIEDEDPGLLAEYFGAGRIVLVEWPEGKEEYLAGLASRVFELKLEHRDERSRWISMIQPTGS